MQVNRGETLRSKSEEAARRLVTPPGEGRVTGEVNVPACLQVFS